MLNVSIDCPNSISWEIASPDGPPHDGHGPIDLTLPPGRYDVIYKNRKGKRVGKDWFEIRPGESQWYIRGTDPWPPDDDREEVGAIQLPLF
jgi:hypothetical protein